MFFIFSQRAVGIKLYSLDPSEQGCQISCCALLCCKSAAQININESALSLNRLSIRWIEDSSCTVVKLFSIASNCSL